MNTKHDDETRYLRTSRITKAIMSDGQLGKMDMKDAFLELIVDMIYICKDEDIHFESLVEDAKADYCHETGDQSILDE